LVPFQNDCLRDERLKEATEHWQPKLILVTITKPHFRIVDATSLSKDRLLFQPLEADTDFNVTHEALEIFEPLVERFLFNGKPNANSLSVRDWQTEQV
jgi:hypothetical protein